MRFLALAVTVALLGTSIPAFSQEPAGKPTTRISKSKKVEEKMARQHAAEQKAATEKAAKEKKPRRFAHQKKK